jgi:hypothetical protein
MLKENMNSPKIYDFYAAFFHFYQLIPNADESSLDLFLNHTLFHLEVTVFHPWEEYARVSQLRTVMLQTFLQKDPDTLGRILTWCISYPLLYAEVLYRVVVDSDLIPSDSDFVVEFARSSMLAFLYIAFQER